VIRLRIAFALVVVVSLVIAPAASAQSKPRITMSGSTSIFPLAVQLAEAYLRDRGKVASFRVLQGGSDIGIADVARGRVSIGNSSRDPKPGDPDGITFNRIARDALCIVTHRQNALPNLSQEQIQAIFSGRVRRWSQVPGSSRTGPIQLIVRTAASGTQDAFQNIFMGPSLRVSSAARTERSNGLQALRIKSNPDAIGYASFNFIDGLHSVPYKGVSCTLRNAKSGQYGGSRNFWMVTRGRPSGAVAKFLRFIRTSAAARRVIETNWVPLR
jgi:phosphate transport system substrate-binding protein